MWRKKSKIGFKPITYDTKESEEENCIFERHPYDNAGIISRFLFNWAAPVVKYGQTNRFNSKILGDPYLKGRASTIKENLKNNWNKFKDNSKNALIRAIWSTYWKDFVIAFSIQFARSLILISQTLLITLILDYIQKPKEEDGGIFYGLGLIVIYIVIGLFGTLIAGMFDFIQLVLGENAKYALITLIYDKVFTLSSATNKSFSQGEITNFINVDADKIPNLTMLLPLVCRFPVQLGFSILLLVFYFGFSLLGSICAGFMLSFIGFFIAKIKAKIQIKILKEKDKRMRSTTEIINNIKTIKLNSLTDYFLDKTTKHRNYEVFLTKIDFILKGMSTFFGRLIAPALVITILAIFYATGNNISVAKAFGGIQVLRTLEFPLRWIPEFISAYLEFNVSMKRIQQFLLCSELNPKLIKTNDKDLEKTHIDVLVENTNFTWGGRADISNDKKIMKDDNIVHGQEMLKANLENCVQLKNISLKIYKGEFVCIIGGVGSGKSSLLHALIGDMIYIDSKTLQEFSQANFDSRIREELCKRNNFNEGVIKLGGSISLVQQTSWIQNMTIRDNILFGMPFEEDKYSRIIEACQLESDLEILKGGDLTEIGEKGINLSGGQKARISLARALYSNSDIFLMDDPLSALDANVKQKVFEMVFCEELKDKTRILVTHAIDFLHLADRVIVMEDGKIKYEGTYNELEKSDEIKNVIETIAKTSIKDEKQNSEYIDDIIEDDPLPNVQKNIIKNILNSTGTNITEDENKELIEVNWKTYHRLFFENKYWIVYLLVVLMFIGYSYFSVYQTYYYGDWIRHGDQNNEYFKYLFICLAHAFGLCFMITSLIILIYTSTIDKSNKLHSKMLSKISKAPINLYFDKTPSGKILNRFSSDISKIDNSIGSSIMNSFECYVCAIFDIYIAALNSLWVLLLVPVLFLIVYFLLKRFSKVYRDLARLKSVCGSPLLTHFSETLNGISTIRAFSISNKKILEDENDICTQHRFIQCNNDNIEKQLNISFWKEGIKGWFSVRITLYSVFIFLFTSIFCIILKDQTDAVLMGMLFIHFLYFNVDILYGSLILTDLESNMTSYVRCQKILEIPQEDPTPFDPHLKSWVKYGKIEFIDYSLRYRPETELALKNLSFIIEPKEKIGILGRTGAGKSTISLALCRIIESNLGKILIDGVDISSISLKKLRKEITIIPQDPTLFEGTLRFNLDPEDIHSDLDLLNILDLASLEYLVLRDDKGLYQIIEEKGQNLSSGEKQLICICRAIIRKNKIVIMDEATANIDIKTEEVIQKLIKEKFEASTVITIAHRLNTVFNSDKVLIMDRGEVVEFDRPQKLIEDKSSILYSFIKKSIK